MTSLPDGMFLDQYGNAKQKADYLKLEQNYGISNNIVCK